VESRPAGTGVDTAVDARPHRAARDAGRGPETDRSAGGDLQASVERSRPPVRAAAPAIEVRPPATSREEVRRAPRAQESAAVESTQSPGAASGSAGAGAAPTADGSAGDASGTQ
jgi:hypothetical protein